MQDSCQTDWNFWRDKINFCRTGGLSVIKLLSLFARNHRTFVRQTEIFCRTDWKFASFVRQSCSFREDCLVHFAQFINKWYFRRKSVLQILIQSSSNNCTSFWRIAELFSLELCYDLLMSAHTCNDDDLSCLRSYVHMGSCAGLELLSLHLSRFIPVLELRN